MKTNQVKQLKTIANKLIRSSGKDVGFVIELTGDIKRPYGASMIEAKNNKLFYSAISFKKEGDFQKIRENLEVWITHILGIRD